MKLIYNASLDSIRAWLKIFPNASWDGEEFELMEENLSLKVSCLQGLKGLSIHVLKGFSKENILFEYAVSDHRELIVIILPDDLPHLSGSSLNPDRKREKKCAQLFNNSLPHHNLFYKNTEFRAIAIIFNSEEFSVKEYPSVPFVRDFMLKEDPTILIESLNHDLLLSVEDIFSYEKDEPGRRAVLYGRALQILGLLIKQVVKKQSTSSKSLSSKNQEIMLAIQQKLDNNLTHPPSLQELGGQFSISPKMIRNNFRKMFGLSPTQYILKNRLNRAYQLLSRSEMPIEEIAFNTGFSSPSHFSNAFRKKFNIKPSEFRKTQHNVVIKLPNDGTA